MPNYGYKCSGCNENFDGFSTVACRNEPVACPNCGNLGYRDVEYELQTCGNFDETTKEHVRYSSSMGCNPKQIPEMERKYPGSRYTPDGRLEIIGRKDKLRKLRQRGMVEFE